MVATAPEMAIDAGILENLTLGDIEDFETAAGVPMSALSDGGVLPFKAVVALVWVIHRQTEPAFTLDDARRLRMADLETLLAPTPAAPLVPLAKARRGSS
jgi:hypothetical protein